VSNDTQYNIIEDKKETTQNLKGFMNFITLSSF